MGLTHIFLPSNVFAHAPVDQAIDTTLRQMSFESKCCTPRFCQMQKNDNSQLQEEGQCQRALKTRQLGAHCCLRNVMPMQKLVRRNNAKVFWIKTIRCPLSMTVEKKTVLALKHLIWCAWQKKGKRQCWHNDVIAPEKLQWKVCLWRKVRSKVTNVQLEKSSSLRWKHHFGLMKERKKKTHMVCLV